MARPVWETVVGEDFPGFFHSFDRSLQLAVFGASTE